MKVVKQHLYMRQAVFLLNVLPCLLLTLLLAACQPTPMEDVVVNKGDGVYEQKLSEAQATAAPQNGQRTEPPAATPVPCLTEPHWKGEIAFRYLTIDIDVDVEAPEAGLFPVYAVEGADFAMGTRAWRRWSTVCSRTSWACVPAATRRRRCTACSTACWRAPMTRKRIP